MPWAIAQTDCWPGTAKVMEECGELVQVLAKLIALGSAGIHWDGSDLRLRIEEEIGDVMGALDFFLTQNDLDTERIVNRREQKFATFLGWYFDRMGGETCSRCGGPREVNAFCSACPPYPPALADGPQASPMATPSTALRALPEDVREWLTDTYDDEGVAIWLRGYERQDEAGKARLLRIARTPSGGT